MIRVFSLYHSSSQGDIKADITDFCKSVSISRSIDSPAAKCDITIVYSTLDLNQPRTQIGPSNIIWIKDDTEGLIFQGIVVDREINSGGQELSFTAYDFMYYLMKSKASYNFRNISAEDVVKKVCNEVDISIGSLASTGLKVNRIIQQKNLYEIIMECYSQVSKQTNKRYIPIMEGTKFNVIQKGLLVNNYCLDFKTNLTSVSYKDTMGSMINRVKIYDEKGNYVNVVENAALFKYFGILQDAYQIEKDKNSITVAKNMLHSIDTTIDVEALGNLKCKTGYAIKTKIWYISTLANATAYIDADTHTWEMGTGKYTMQLSLNLSNTMDFKEVE